MNPSIKTLLAEGTQLSDDQTALKQVSGWVRFKRHVGNKTTFICLYDGSSLDELQCVCLIDQLSDDQWSTIRNLTIGSSVQFRGIMIDSPADGQKYEFQVQEAILLGDCPTQTFPLAKNEFTMEYFRKFPHLRSRSRIMQAIMRIRSTLALATHDFYRENGFIYLHTPLITGSDCEGAGEVFRLATVGTHKIQQTNLDTNEQTEIEVPKEFFDKPAYLTVSGQLNGETYACGMSRIYTFGPTFRADPSQTNRHLAEFWMIEPEIAFCNLEQLMPFAQEYVQYCIRQVLTKNEEDIKFLEEKQSPKLLERLTNLATQDFIRLPYTEAIEKLNQHQLDHFTKTGEQLFEVLVEWGLDLGSEHEKYLVDQIYNQTPIILYDYPSSIKPFYMKENPEDKYPNKPPTVGAMDVLVPGIGELIGGSQRETDLKIITTKMKKQRLNKKDYQEYLDLRRFGSVPHSGFGLGFDRLVLLATGTASIKDVIPFPRSIGYLPF